MIGKSSIKFKIHLYNFSVQLLKNRWGRVSAHAIACINYYFERSDRRNIYER